jgi:DNA-binding MarR family transcriptional regulator
MKTGPKVKSVEDRFWARVEKTDGCWLAGGKNYGNKYLPISLGPKRGQTSMHRFSFELHHGPVPLGLFVCHKCDVKNCVNPEHLYAGTHESNNLDSIDRGLFAGPRAPSRVQHAPGRRYGGPGRAMTKEQREQLRAEYASGEWTQMQLAARYHINQSTVSATIRRVANMGVGEHKARRTGHFRFKVTPEQRQEIWGLYATGRFTQQQLAEKFGCDQTRISVLVRTTVEELQCAL